MNVGAILNTLIRANTSKASKALARTDAALEASKRPPRSSYTSPEWQETRRRILGEDQS